MYFKGGIMSKLKVTVWNEYRHEKKNPKIRKIYPKGMHAVIAAALNKDKAILAKTATLDEPEHGLTEEVLKNTDVLIWWGHMAHKDVKDEIVDRVQKYVLNGMGLIVLHSGHFSKIFRRMMGTSCILTWREAGENERLWVTQPGHPIAEGLPEYFELKHEEMYGEFFDIPHPEAQVFVSWFKGGEIFRSGCCWTRGKGKIFYFRPGHETHPTYYDKNVQRVIRNAALWAAPVKNSAKIPDGNSVKPLEKL